MARRIHSSPSSFIAPLDINGLEGRVLRLPGGRKKAEKEILIIHGYHASLERWWGLDVLLSRYGTVTMPDLPGFGGMDSFYTIGRKPTIDNFADYLASFIKMRYKRKRVAIIGMGFGFVVVTRMLQRYPELTTKVDLLVSIFGFAHQDDFSFSRPQRMAYRWSARLLSLRLPALAARYFGLRPVLVRYIYGRVQIPKTDLQKPMNHQEWQRLIAFEIGLWRTNDLRTYMYVTADLLRLDNCARRIDMPVWQVVPRKDDFFDGNMIEQHLRVIFSDYYPAKSLFTAHLPAVIATEETAVALVPAKLRRILQKL